MKLKIIKIFNNNSIAALSDELGDIILTGSGIGFQKKIGDLVDESRIEKTYIFKEKGEKRIRRGINDIEPIYYEITSLLVSKATEQLNTQFYGEIFLAISDHIAFAIKRKKENIDLPNVVLSETKALYKKEYQLGLWIIKMIKEKTDIQLEEAEAGYIALHLVNFSTKNNAQNTSKIVNFVKDVFDIIEKTMCIKLELDSIDYARLSTHLKFLAERVFRHDIGNTIDTTENIIMIAVSDDGTEQLDEEDKLLLKECGFQIDFSDKFRYSYIGIKDNNKVEENISEKKVHCSKQVTNNTNVEVTSGGALSDTIISIKVNELEIASGGRGFNIVVYNTATENVLSSVFFDTYAEANPQTGIIKDDQVMIETDVNYWENKDNISV